MVENFLIGLETLTIYDPMANTPITGVQATYQTRSGKKNLLERRFFPDGSEFGQRIAILQADLRSYFDTHPEDESGVPITLLDQAKILKRLTIDAEWLAVEKLGWDSGLGYSLGIVSTDVALLAGVYLLAKEASALGLPLPDLISMDNSIIPFATLADMTTLLLRYGAARSTVAGTFATKRKAVVDALTIAEVELI